MSNALDTLLQDIVSRLEEGVAPWRQPWKGGGDPHMPLRVSGEAYSGGNAILLAMSGAMQGFASPYWMTFQQALALGAGVRKGCKASPALLYKTKTVDADQDTGADEKVLRFLKTYSVFCADQIEGLPESFSQAPKRDPAMREAAQHAILSAIPAEVRHGGSKAYFHPGQDYIQMPPVECFDSIDAWRATYAHEAAHWSGHADRLNRQFGEKFGDDAYAFEEMIAESASCLLSLHMGSAPQMLDNHAAYLQHWAKILKKRPTALLEAFGQGQKAVDHLLAYSQPASALQEAA